MENFTELFVSELYKIQGEYIGNWAIGYEANTNQYINISEISNIRSCPLCWKQKIFPEAIHKWNPADAPSGSKQNTKRRGPPPPK